MTTILIDNQLRNFVRPSEHSLYSPSAAEQWMACAARKNLIKDIPSETSSFAEEGTLAHSVCEAVFRERWYSIPFPSDLYMQMLSYQDHGDEMLQCAHLYADVLESWVNDKERIGQIIWFGLEKGIPIYPALGCFGTADCVIVGTKGAAIIDFKYGKGKDVSANSLQLRVYLSGLFLHLKNLPDNYMFHSVVFQPRILPVPKHTTYAPEEIKKFSDDVFAAITKSEIGGDPIEGHHCYWCPAKRTHDFALKCPLIKERPLKAAQENFAQFLQDMNMPGPLKSEYESTNKRDEAMMKIISIAPLIQQIAEDSKEEFMHRIEHGETIEGLMIVDKLGNRKLNFENDEQAIKVLSESYPKIETYETKTITKIKPLAKLEKLLGKEELNKLCTRPIKKELKVMDEKTRELLGKMSVYENMITASQTHNPEE